MYSHVTVGTSNLRRAMTFYDAALAPLGLTRKRTRTIRAVCHRPAEASVAWPFTIA